MLYRAVASELRPAGQTQDLPGAQHEGTFVVTLDLEFVDVLSVFEDARKHFWTVRAAVVAALDAPAERLHEGLVVDELLVHGLLLGRGRRGPLCRIVEALAKTVVEIAGGGVRPGGCRGGFWRGGRFFSGHEI